MAVTHVDQVFFNPNDWAVEGTYLFPLPLDAVVTQFTLWVDGKPVQAEILDASQARQKYEEIVRSLRDPALLEYAGRGAVQASIFPIPPRGERRIELEYSQVLTAENGEQAIARSRSDHPDLILMDVVMPGMNGYQATRTISRDDETRDIPIIMCTSKGQETDKIWGMRQGALDYLVKPVDHDELLARIRAMG